MAIVPYLFFEGRCQEALDFYRDQLGAEILMIMRYKESPASLEMVPLGNDEKILHATFRIGDGEVMASDGMCAGNAAFQGFSLSIPAPDAAHAKRVFDALADGGTVQMPLSETFFSPSFGMVADKFGVGWMVVVPAPMPQCG
jgi:PhnB protein